MIITRNHLPSTNGPFSRDDLDALGDIQVELEADDLSGLSTPFPNANYLRNADLSVWTRGTSPVALSHKVRTDRADHWWARSDYGVVGSGGSGTFAQYEQAADSVHQQWLYCAKLTGAVFTSSIDFGQDIPARVAAGLDPHIMLTLEVENDTGADLTPTVRVDTCNTFESWGSVTNRIAQAVDSAVSNAAHKTWTVALDTTGFLSSLRNGFQIYVRFTGVNDPSKFVKVFAAKLELGDTATDRAIERDNQPVDTSTGTTTTQDRQYFDNGNFSRWLAEEIACVEDKDTYTAPAWFANPTDGSTLAYKRTDQVPDTNSIYSAELTGDTPVSGTVDFGQNLERAIAGETRRDLVFSIAVWNGTGTAFTPELRIDTCNDVNTFDDVANQIAQTLDICANSAWTTLTYTFNGGGITNWANGARIYLRFPTGVLNNNAKSVRITQGRLERGTAASTFVPIPDVQPPAEIGSTMRGVYVKWVDATHFDVSIDEMVLSDRGGRNLRLSGPRSFPGIDLSTSGAGGLDYPQTATVSTWHYIWVASTGESTAVFISKSATDPTLAPGYLFRARIGAVYVTATPDLKEFAIVDGRHYIVGHIALANVNPTLATKFQELDLAIIIPPEARRVFGSAGIHSTEDCQMIVAASGLASTTMTDGLGAVTITGAGSSAAVMNQFRVSAPFELPVVTPQKMYWAAAVKAATAYQVIITGWTL